MESGTIDPRQLQHHTVAGGSTNGLQTEGGRASPASTSQAGKLYIPTVREALPYTPFSSIVPFNSGECTIFNHSSPVPLVPHQSAGRDIASLQLQLLTPPPLQMSFHHHLRFQTLHQQSFTTTRPLSPRAANSNDLLPVLEAPSRRRTGASKLWTMSGDC